MDIGYMGKVEGYLWVDEECILNEVCWSVFEELKLNFG